jgi:hypothetical protein
MLRTSPKVCLARKQQQRKIEIAFSALFVRRRMLFVGKTKNFVQQATNSVRKNPTSVLKTAGTAVKKVLGVLPAGH